MHIIVLLFVLALFIYDPPTLEGTAQALKPLVLPFGYFVWFLILIWPFLAFADWRQKKREQGRRDLEPERHKRELDARRAALTGFAAVAEALKPPAPTQPVAPGRLPRALPLDWRPSSPS